MTKRKKESLPPLDTKEIAAINEALIAKYGAKLKPGESLALDLKRTAEHAHATLVLSNADDTFRMEMEAALLDSDETEETEVAPAARHLIAVDFIDAMLDEYFTEDRHARFHDDWRLDEFADAIVRSRGAERRPQLEVMADAWLDAGGDPDLVSD